MSLQIKKHLTSVPLDGLSTDSGSNGNTMVDTPSDHRQSDWQVNQEDPFLVMSQDQIQKLDAVLSSEQAKAILGETSSQFGLPRPQIQPNYQLAGGEPSEVMDKTIEENLNYIMNGSNLGMLGNKAVDFLQVFDSSGVPIQVVGSDLLVEDVEVEMAAEILVDGIQEDCELDIELILKCIRLDHSYCVVPVPEVGEDGRDVQEIGKKGETKSVDYDSAASAKDEPFAAEKGDAAASLVRRSQRQIEKSEREQLEKIKAENAELQRREKEDMLKIQALESDSLEVGSGASNKSTTDGQSENDENRAIVAERTPETTPSSTKNSRSVIGEEPPSSLHLSAPVTAAAIIPQESALDKISSLKLASGETASNVDLCPLATDAISAVPQTEFNSVDQIPKAISQEKLVSQPVQTKSSTQKRHTDSGLVIPFEGENAGNGHASNVGHGRDHFLVTNNDALVPSSKDQPDRPSTPMPMPEEMTNEPCLSGGVAPEMQATLQGDFPIMPFDTVESLVSRLSGGSGVDTPPHSRGSNNAAEGDGQEDNVASAESKVVSVASGVSQNSEQATKRERSADDIFGRVVQRRLSDGLKKESSFSKNSSSKQDTVRKSYPKRENRKPPGRLMDMLEPALFSKPDRMKKIDTNTRSESIDEDGKQDGNSTDSGRQVEPSVVEDCATQPRSQEEFTERAREVPVESLESKPDEIEEYLSKRDSQVFTVECEQQDGSLQILEIAGSPVSDQVGMDTSSLAETIQAVVAEGKHEKHGGERRPQVVRASQSPKERRKKSKISKKPAVASKDRMDGKQKIQGKVLKNVPVNIPPRQIESESDSGDSDDSDSDSSWCSEDDPDRLWCICKQPHNNRFMINCDGCEDWFHGSCVGITRRLGRELEKSGKEWVCPKCTKAREEQKKPKSAEDKEVKVEAKVVTHPEQVPLKLNQDKAVVTSVKNVNTVGVKKVSTERPAKKSVHQRPERPPKMISNQQPPIPSVKNPLLPDKDDKETVRKAAPALRSPLPSDKLTSQQCMMGCGRPARTDSIFCGNECILQHAHESRKDKEKVQPSQKLPGPPKNPMEIGRIPVIERCTGRIMKGLGAPTEQDLVIWLKKHPTYEVLRPAQGHRNIPSSSRPGKTPPPPPPPPITPPAPPRNTPVQPPERSFYGQPQRKTIKLISAQPMPVENPENPKAKGISSRTASIEKPEDKKAAMTEQPKHPPEPVKSRPAADPRTIKQGLDAKARIVISNSRIQQANDPRTKPSIDTTKVKSLFDQRTKSLVDTRIKSPTELKIKPVEIRSRNVVEAKTTKSPAESRQPPQTPPPPAAPPNPEPIRSNVRTTLKEVLTSRIKNTEDESMTPESIVQIATLIEDELFKLFSDVGTKYKAKYRSLMFNIKDSRNHGLYRKILRGTISPQKLVRMTPEELASKELAMWRERETKHTLEMIKREQEEQQLQHIPIIKKTHKGEIEIDDDGVGFSEKSKLKSEVIAELPSSAVVDTTDSHRSHLLDLNCKICTGKMLAPSDEETPTKKARVAKSISLESRSQDEDDSEEETAATTVSIPPKEKAPVNETEKAESESKKQVSGHATEEKKKDKNDKKTKKKVKIEDKGTALETDSKKKDSSRKEKSKSEERKDEKKPNEGERKDGGKDSEKKEKSKDINKKGKSKDSSVRKVKKVRIEKISSQDNVSDREPSSTVTISSPDSAEPSQSDNSKNQPSVWKGFITMLEIAKFVTNAYKVSGPTDFLGQDIPDTIDVCGRITPNTVWEYLSKVKQSGNKEFLVIRFSPANEEEKEAYVSFYTYLSSRNRFGVVGNSSRMIKDFYILPLSSGSSIPATLLPFDGPGLEEIRPHMLLGVIIRHRGKRKAGGKDASRKGSKSKKSGLNSTDLEISNDSNDVGSDAKAAKKVKFDLTVKSDATVPYEPSYTPPLIDRKKKINSDDDSSPYEPSFTPPLEQRRRKRGGGNDSPYSPGHADDDDDPNKPYDPEEAEEAAKMSKTIIPGLLAGSVSSQSVSELIDQISMSSNPTGITTTVLASIATTTNLEQKRQLLIELTQKVEEQKRQLEMQKQQIATKVTAQVMGVIAPFTVVHPIPAPPAIPAVEDNAKTMMDKLTSDTEAYSPSYTPPLENSSNLDSLLPPLKLPDTSSISLPPNLQEILESIKKQGSSAPEATVPAGISATKESVKPLLEDPIIKNFSTVEMEEPVAAVVNAVKEEKVTEVDVSSDPAVQGVEKDTVVTLPVKQSDPRLKRKATAQSDPRLKPAAQEPANKSTLGSLTASELMAIALKQFEDLPPPVITPPTKKKKTGPQKNTAGKVAADPRSVVSADENGSRTSGKEALPFKSIPIKPPASRKITINIPTEIGAQKEPPPPGLDNGENENEATASSADTTELPPAPQMVAYPIPFMPPPPVRPPFSSPPPGFGPHPPPPPPMFAPFTQPPPFPPPIGGNFWPPNQGGQQDWRGGGPRFRGRGRGRWQNRGHFENRPHFPPGNDWNRQDRDDRQDWPRDRDYRGDRDHYRERDRDWNERRDRRHDHDRKSGDRDERRGRSRRHSSEWDGGRRSRDRRSSEKDERRKRDRRSSDKDDGRRGREGRSSERDERHNRDRSGSRDKEQRRSRSSSSDRERRRSRSSSGDREKRRSRSSSSDGEKRGSRDKDDRRSKERS